MKKIVGMFIIMVVVALMATMAFGEQYLNGTRDDAYRKVLDWAEAQGYVDYVNWTENYDEMKFCGVFSIDEAKEQFGDFSTIDDLFIIWVKWCKELYNADVNVKLMGDIEGTNVYRIEGIQVDNEGHERFESILFIIYNDKNE